MFYIRGCVKLMYIAIIFKPVDNKMIIDRVWLEWRFFLLLSRQNQLASISLNLSLFEIEARYREKTYLHYFKFKEYLLLVVNKWFRYF